MAKTVKVKQPHSTPAAKTFTIRYPLLWLAVSVIVVYFSTLKLGVTELDDTIFVNEMSAYNEDVSNLTTSFHRGVFDATKDPYYRPLFLDLMILNYQVSGDKIEGYHFINLLLHLGSVLLLFWLFRKLEIDRLNAFLLTLLFAVHPVLCQAVAWIPGRNDTLMAVFILSFLICCIEYIKNGRPLFIGLSVLFLIGGFFTKETALLSPLIAFVLITMIVRSPWLFKRNLILYCGWITGLLIYFGVRATATLKPTPIGLGQLWHDFISRLPLLIQYIGKIFLPFNLSVFPTIKDTGYYYGIAAVLLLVWIIVKARNKNVLQIIAGFLVFFLFLVPVLLVPNSLNEQSFEHRLYLPIIGILLVLPETILFRNQLAKQTLVLCFAIIAILFGILNYLQQQFFSDPVTFWKQAYTTSPHSAYATMMYAARLEDNRPEAFTLMRQAYTLNPHEKYINYYYGAMLQEQDSLLESEKYFLEEKKNSNYYKCDFHLARIAYQKKQLPQAISYLENYLKYAPADQMASNNLLLMYMETKQKNKAKILVEQMRHYGMTLPAITLQQIEALP